MRRIVRRAAAPWVLAVAVSLVGLWAFASVGEDVFEHETGSFDDAVRRWVLGHRTPALYAFFLGVTHLGSTTAVVALVAVAAFWLWRAHHRRGAAVALLAPAAAVGVFVPTKQLLERARPAGAVALHELAYSFPSGHATTSAAVFGTLAYVLARERLLRPGAAAALALAPPLLIGASRVVLDVHWATDVLAGWAAGLAVAALGAAVYERLRPA